MPDERDLAIVAGLEPRIPEADPVALINFAWFAARRGQLAVALRAARKAAALPSRPAAAIRAVEQLRAGRVEGLILLDEPLPAAPEPSPTENASGVDPVHSLARARELLSRGQTGACLAVLAPILNDRPTHTEALFLSGVALAKQRRYAEALEAWTAVGRVDPDGPIGSISRKHARSARELANLFLHH